jgi:hypothetical protein
MKTILITMALTLSIGNAMACTIQNIITPDGVISCYICPNQPPYCQRI